MRPSPTLVGRDREVAALDEALIDTAGASGSLVLVTGEAGIGKSRLAQEASAHARTRGFRVLAGRAVDGGSHIPFRPVAEALAAAVRHVGVPESAILQPYRHVLANLTPDWGESDRTPASPIAISEAVLRLLVVLGGPDGLMLVLEDAAAAEVHIVLQSHGQAHEDPALLEEQLTTFGGACNPECTDSQLALHLP